MVRWSAQEGEKVTCGTHKPAAQQRGIAERGGVGDHEAARGEQLLGGADAAEELTGEGVGHSEPLLLPPCPQRDPPLVSLLPTLWCASIRAPASAAVAPGGSGRRVEEKAEPAEVLVGAEDGCRQWNTAALRALLAGHGGCGGALSISIPEL